MGTLFAFILVSVIVAIPIFMQQTAYQGIDESKFKKYKIKRFGFLFRGMQGQSASTHGVILPMLVIQIQGYVVGLVTLIFVIINETIHIVNDSVLVTVIVLFIHAIVAIAITVITGLISKRR